MATALVLIVLILVAGAIVSAADRDPEGLVVAVGAVAVVLVVWALIAWPLSSYKKDVCQQKAEGYGLERSQWSIRHKCRVYLPGGELVPEDRIRITVDGQIIVTDDT